MRRIHSTWQQTQSSIIANLMPYSKVSVVVSWFQSSKGWATGDLLLSSCQLIGEQTFTPTLTTVQLRGSTSLISCRSARADFLHHLRFLTPSHAFLLFHPAHFPPSPANRPALVTITSRSSLLSFPLVVIAPDSYGISFPWPRKKVF